VHQAWWTSQLALNPQMNADEHNWRIDDIAGTCCSDATQADDESEFKLQDFFTFPLTF
jgi:hypothetical protein